MALTVSQRAQVVGALACQRNSYLETLETEVISCEKRPRPEAKKGGPKGKSAVLNGDDQSEIWQIEFSDSVLFPEGGGQPSDHGSVTLLSGSSETPIPIEFVERIGLRCCYHSPRPLTPGVRVRQDVDFQRRWDHMQQHTGQHLLSAVMDTYENLQTLGWGMGKSGAMNYIDLPRKPTETELEAVQTRCNAIIRSNLPITVEALDDAKVHKIPEDYDLSKGVVRVIRIGDIDRNTCCGTHLSQTSHISLILLHHGESVHGKNYRLYFSVGDRAINLATASIGAMSSMSKLLSCRSTVDEVVQMVQKSQDSVSELKKREKKLLADIAQFEVDAAKTMLQTGKSVWIHRADGNADFVKWVSVNIKDVVASSGGVVFIATGEEKQSGQLVIFGKKASVEILVPKVKELVKDVKGGGDGEKWQGKVSAWDKGALRAMKELVESNIA